jgi:hypothetical protein
MATTTTTTGRAVWVHDRAARMTDLCERLDEMIEYLARERADCYQDPARRRVIDRRLWLTRERLQRYRTKARNLRRTARVLAAHAAAN